MISLKFTEVIPRLAENGILCWATMKDGEFNQIIGQDNPNVRESTWFIIEDGQVEVEGDFRELYPL